MKLIIDIPEEVYKNHTLLNYFKCYSEELDAIIYRGKPLLDITDEQISDAFQLAIANYWESKSKYLTPPPTPCDCPIKKEAEN